MQNTRAQCGCRACERARAAEQERWTTTQDLSVALGRAQRLYQAEMDDARARVEAAERERDAARAQLAEVERERDGARADLYETREDLRRPGWMSAAQVLRQEMRLRAAAELDRDRHLATLETLARERMLCSVCLRATGERRNATIWASAGGPHGFPVCLQCFDGQGKPAQQPPASSRNVEHEDGAAISSVDLHADPTSG